VRDSIEEHRSRDAEEKAPEKVKDGRREDEEAEAQLTARSPLVHY
jgi:hypothetical protein